MSSAIYITFRKTVKLEEWLTFCKEEKIEYAPDVIGGDTFYVDGDYHGVQVKFGEGKLGGTLPFSPPAEGKRVVVSTFWMGPMMERVAETSRKVLARFSGRYTCDPELKRLMLEKDSARK